MPNHKKAVLTCLDCFLNDHRDDLMEATELTEPDIQLIMKEFLAAGTRMWNHTRHSSIRYLTVFDYSRGKLNINLLMVQGNCFRTRAICGSYIWWWRCPLISWLWGRLRESLESKCAFISLITNSCFYRWRIKWKRRESLYLHSRTHPLICLLSLGSKMFNTH